MAATGFPQDVAALLGRLRDRLAAREDVVGVYVYGSLVTADYSPVASDIDVIVLVQREPGQVMTRELTQMHIALAATGGPAGQLHCLYVAADSASDPDRLCTYWFGDRMTQWQMKLGEAISRLAGFEVPGSLAQEIQRRCDGLPVAVSGLRRLSRAMLARRIMQNGVARLSRLGPSVSRPDG